MYGFRIASLYRVHHTFDLHIQEGNVVVVVELRVEAADGAILARDREQPVEGVRDEHVVKAEVLGFVRNRDESATVEAARSSTRGGGSAPSGPASRPGSATPPSAARRALRRRRSQHRAPARGHLVV